MPINLLLSLKRLKKKKSVGSDNPNYCDCVVRILKFIFSDSTSFKLTFF